MTNILIQPLLRLFGWSASDLSQYGTQPSAGVPGGSTASGDHMPHAFTGHIAAASHEVQQPGSTPHIPLSPDPVHPAAIVHEHGPVATNAPTVAVTGAGAPSVVTYATPLTIDPRTAGVAPSHGVFLVGAASHAAPVNDPGAPAATSSAVAAMPVSHAPAAVAAIVADVAHSTASVADGIEAVTSTLPAVATSLLGDVAHVDALVAPVLDTTTALAGEIAHDVAGLTPLDSVIAPVETVAPPVIAAVENVATPVEGLVAPVIGELAHVAEPAITAVAATVAPVVAGTTDATHIAAIAPAVSSTVDAVADDAVHAAETVTAEVAPAVTAVAAPLVDTVMHAADLVGATGSMLTVPASTLDSPGTPANTADHFAGADPAGGIQTLVTMVDSIDAFHVGPADSTPAPAAVIDTLAGDDIGTSLLGVADHHDTHHDGDVHHGILGSL